MKLFKLITALLLAQALAWMREFGELMEFVRKNQGIVCTYI